MAPPWPTVTLLMVNTIEEIAEDYEKKNANRDLKIHFNFSNILAILAKVLKKFVLINN